MCYFVQRDSSLDTTTHNDHAKGGLTDSGYGTSLQTSKYIEYGSGVGMVRPSTVVILEQCLAWEFGQPATKDYCYAYQRRAVVEIEFTSDQSPSFKKTATITDHLLV